MLHSLSASELYSWISHVPCNIWMFDSLSVSVYCLFSDRWPPDLWPPWSVKARVTSAHLNSLYLFIVLCLLAFHCLCAQDILPSSLLFHSSAGWWHSHESWGTRGTLKKSWVDILVFYRSLSVISVPSASFNSIVFWFEVQKNIQMAITSSSSRYKTVRLMKRCFLSSVRPGLHEISLCCSHSFIVSRLFSATWPLITQSVQTLPLHSALKCSSFKLLFITSKRCYCVSCLDIFNHQELSCSSLQPTEECVISTAL